MRWAYYLALACAIALGGVSTARGAVYTTINNPVAPGEDGIEKILENIYGGNFSPSGVDFSNGSINAIRIDDALDQVWQDNFQQASVKTIFANYKQEFGYLPGASGGSYTKLLDATGYGYATGPGSVSLAPVGTGPIRWARDGEGELYTSLPANNSDGLDHMVSYRIEGLSSASNGVVTYLLFWEDLSGSSECSDFDYNDLVLQITAVVPEPISMAPLLGLAFLSLRRRQIQPNRPVT